MTATLSERPARRRRTPGVRAGRRGRPAERRERRERRQAPPTGAQAASTVASSALTMTALVCLWAATQMVLLGGLSHQRSQDLLYTDFRTQLAGATAPLGPIVPAGDPVAVVSVPRIGMEEVVVEGTASGDTLAGPGHRRDTPLPGQEGISVVYGRAATYGGPFRHLTELRRGDEISVAMAQGRLTFHVLGVRHSGDPLPQPVAAGRARLTLVTAEGSGRLSAITPDRTVYVDAEAKKAFPAPSGRPATVPASETAMAADPAAMPLLTLRLALLVALTLGVVAARQRWTTALVWVVASPLALALSWATTDVVMRLLPNLI